VGISLYSFAEVIAMGASDDSAVSFDEPKADSIFIFSYTSGTTGNPKAVMLTHKNIIASASCPIYIGVVLDNKDTIISYLPYAHSFGQFLFVTSLIRGLRIGYYSGDPLKLLDDLQAL